MKKRHRQFIFLSSGLLFLTVGFPLISLAFFPNFFSANAKDDTATQKVIEKFSVTKPVKKDTSICVDYIANLQAIKHVQLKSRIKGVINQIHVDEGQLVKSGTVLFTLSSQEYETELLKARSSVNSAIAELKSAEVELKSTIELVQKGIESSTQLELGKAKIEALEAKVEEAKSLEENAKLHLSFTTITAPFEGIIGRIPNKVGSLEEEGTLLTTISDNSQIHTYFNVSEKEYLKLLVEQDKAKERVSLILANQQTYLHEGIIETQDNHINSETGTIAFRATFPNPDRNLKHGATGKVQIKRQIKNALLIPQIATVETQDMISVFVLDNENTIHRKKVSVLFRLPHLYVLGSVLSTDDRIIYQGLQHVEDGMSVDPEMVDFLTPIMKPVIALNH
ncbi:MAG: efflux RND transporter periplasmic adaptor subunit [Cyclobacteriaceae bacterium]